MDKLGAGDLIESASVCVLVKMKPQKTDLNVEARKIIRFY